jgi:hypothetical protein
MGNYKQIFIILLLTCVSCSQGKMNKNLTETVCKKSYDCITCNKYEDGTLTAEYQMNKDSVLDGFYRTYQPQEQLSVIRQFINGNMSKLYHIIDYDKDGNIENIREIFVTSDSVENQIRYFGFDKNISFDPMISDFYTCTQKLVGDSILLTIKGFFVLDDIANLRINKNIFPDTISMKKMGERKFEATIKYPKKYEMDTIIGQLDTYAKNPEIDGYFAQHQV